ncbi:anaphase-promoting complex subunit 4-like [Selaginella moellendorffii]|uniref:anaphase-promoting complex subunit 4-like n=1 Tax=Selaginella moellendorffii TaxID=88036 RepID=UPI000D1C9A97|nr:anaphase-promoting complex subunit 4-like [Selaginella moellendorffii]XP_024536653.1 anaphase-promoting complex subunit 4-like [Selaginella moellendorffii]|eukprot:XP_024536652.1 anaphase-promoting complex subunit 4-like [Selaginella moellendorffii]
MADQDPQAMHFTLHLDKPIACQVEIASWNPEKDLLAMVSTDHQLTVHRFNWQKLWTISPEKRITAICWRPDGKALAVGHENGEISLHDVENGEVLRTLEAHKASVQCVYWVEERSARSQGSTLHEDRTSRFFPPPPKPPAMPGTGPAFDMAGAFASGDDQENISQNAASKHSEQYLNILCSSDSNGLVCLNAFGLFAIGELNLHNFPNWKQLSAVKVMLSGDLCNMILLCHDQDKNSGLVSISVDTTLLNSRRNEIRQVALQASSIEELLEVLQTTLTVMRRHWVDAMSAFADKFSAFQSLLRENGSLSTPRDELLTLLACGSASVSLHQFLAVTLGEGGLKKLGKSIDTAGREIQVLIADHLQPAAEILAFRIGELLGLSRWRSQLQSIGLDEVLVNSVMENAGMLMVQVERFLHVVSDTVGQYRLFFVWLTKSLRLFNAETSPLHTEPINSTAIATFLRQQFDSDLIGPHVISEGVLPNIGFEEDLSKAEELLLLGGFQDVKFLQRTLFQQLNCLCDSWRAAISKPVAVISPRLCFKSHLFLCEFPKLLPLSCTYYEMKTETPSFVDYTCFEIHTDGPNHIGVLRGFNSQSMGSDGNEVEAVVLQLNEHLTCLDFSLYKEKQLLLLLNERLPQCGGSQAWIMVLELEELPFISLKSQTNEAGEILRFCTSNDALAFVGLRSGKSRSILQLDVIPPIAVSASRGLACVFAAQKRAMLYDLEEDEEEKDD